MTISSLLLRWIKYFSIASNYFSVTSSTIITTNKRRFHQDRTSVDYRDSNGAKLIPPLTSIRVLKEGLLAIASSRRAPFTRRRVWLQPNCIHCVAIVFVSLHPAIARFLLAPRSFPRANPPSSASPSRPLLHSGRQRRLVGRNHHLKPVSGLYRWLPIACGGTDETITMH